MAANTTAITALQRTAVNTKSLIIAKQKCVLYDLAVPKPFPEKGKVVSWFKQTRFTPSRTAISETETSATAVSLSPETVTATLAAYGMMTDTSELRRYTAWDQDAQSMNDLSTLLGIGKAETYELLFNDLLFGYQSATGGLTKIYADTAHGTGNSNIASITTTDVMDTYWLDYAVRTIKNGLAQPFDNKGWVCVVDPDTAFWLRMDSRFEDVVKYQNADRIFNGEIGRWGGCTILEHSRYSFTGDGTTHLFATTTSFNDAVANGITVHPVYVLGKEAFGTTKLDTDSTRGFILIDQPDSNNLWRQMIYMGFKIWWAGAILDAHFGATVYCSRD